MLERENYMASNNCVNPLILGTAIVAAGYAGVQPARADSWLAEINVPELSPPPLSAIVVVEEGPSEHLLLDEFSDYTPPLVETGRVRGILRQGTLPDMEFDF